MEPWPRPPPSCPSGSSAPSPGCRCGCCATTTPTACSCPQRSTRGAGTVARATVPATTVVALRGTVPTYAHQGLLWERLLPALAAQEIAPTGACGVVEHDEEYVEHDVDLSAFVPVAPGTRAEPPLEVIELPERDCLVARVVGPYAQIAAAHDVLGERLAAEGLAARSDGTVAGKAFNRYLTTPDQVGEDELVTEVCVPVA